MLPQLRVALTPLGLSTPEYDPFIQDATFAYRGRLPDDDAHPVVDEHALTNSCSWVNLDARDKSVRMRNQSSGEAPVVGPKSMCYAVKP